MVVLFMLFLWQTVYATLKYLEKTTIASTTHKDEESILFPSITVCKKYLMGLNEEKIHNASMLIAKISRLNESMWRRNEVFYFFSHTNMFNLTFPCTTVNSLGTSPGKPCSFPFRDWGELKTKCEVPHGFCFTRYITIDTSYVL